MSSDVMDNPLSIARITRDDQQNPRSLHSAISQFLIATTGASNQTKGLRVVM